MVQLMVQLNDSLKTWWVTLKAQLFLGGVLFTLITILLYSLPSAEYEALRQYMKWQQKTETPLSEDTLILSLDDTSTEFLKKRFNTPTLNDAFYKRLLKDLQTLNVANVVLALAPAHTYNTTWQSWKVGRLKITQGFPVSNVLKGNRLVGDERVGIMGKAICPEKTSTPTT